MFVESIGGNLSTDSPVRQGASNQPCGSSNTSLIAVGRNLKFLGSITRESQYRDCENFPRTHDNYDTWDNNGLWFKVYS